MVRAKHFWAVAVAPAAVWVGIAALGCPQTPSLGWLLCVGGKQLELRNSMLLTFNELPGITSTTEINCLYSHFLLEMRNKVYSINLHRLKLACIALAVAQAFSYCWCAGTCSAAGTQFSVWALTYIWTITKLALCIPRTLMVANSSSWHQKLL